VVVWPCLCFLILSTDLLRSAVTEVWVVAAVSVVLWFVWFRHSRASFYFEFLGVSFILVVAVGLHRRFGAVSVSDASLVWCLLFLCSYCTFCVVCFLYCVYVVCLEIGYIITPNSYILQINYQSNL
jgi:hypothetical protein